MHLYRDILQRYAGLCSAFCISCFVEVEPEHVSFVSEAKDEVLVLPLVPQLPSVSYNFCYYDESRPRRKDLPKFANETSCRRMRKASLPAAALPSPSRCRCSVEQGLLRSAVDFLPRLTAFACVDVRSSALDRTRYRIPQRGTPGWQTGHGARATSFVMQFNPFSESIESSDRFHYSLTNSDP